MEAFVVSQQQQQRSGIRRLLVLSGEQNWCLQEAIFLRGLLAGDWLWVGPTAPAVDYPSLAARQVRGLLGHEYLHAVFDARDGLDVESLVMLAGTLRAGSWLILLAPSWDDWAFVPDADSLRWSEQPAPIATPRFIQHMQQCLLADPEVVLWRQHTNSVISPPVNRPDWTPANGTPSAEQRALLQRLLAEKPAITVITAPRGRGKSTLAGMLARRCQSECWVTAPSRSASDILLQQAGEQVRFWAPDALLDYCRQPGSVTAEWLLIDEAAAIPTPQLAALLPFFRHVVMTTTVLGYEGTGRGFLLKFCASLPAWREMSLTEPLRWAVDDPIERVLDRIMMFDAEQSVVAQVDAPFVDSDESRDRWQFEPTRLAECYGLLCSAHYRTSPLDLRRLLDAPGMHITSVRGRQGIVGVVWLVDEGGLSESLAREVWAGRRRPRGNLVAQSLAAHGNQWRAPVLRSRRITRIAVLAAHRCQGIGQALVAAQVRQARQLGIDFLSVSFGFQPDLWQFWQRCGFQLARIGTHVEASSGCYSVMVILPLSEEGHRLAQDAYRQLCRDGGEWYDAQLLPLTLPSMDDDSLTSQDWMNLAGFALAYRTPEACRGALVRLLRHSPLPLESLRLWLERQWSVGEMATYLQISGRKALVHLWRSECAEALQRLDAGLYQRWRDWVVLAD
ncbi:tRNA(Met) cytidine acetyltransferase TmcA [Musicola keenii]|uniref:tRNA(Met) cytidine acetyltransferase TmcA n=1 Tax=Musicola keenii TaxID=2884250 RepID=UPI00177C16B7